MPDASNGKRARARRGLDVNLVRPVLMVLGAAVGLLAIVGIFVVLDVLTSVPARPGFSALEVYALVAAFVGGLVVVAGLLALAVLLDLARKMSANAERLARLLNGGDSNGNNQNAYPNRRTPTTELPQPAFEEILRSLRDLRDNSLLSDEQKQAKLDRLTRDHRRRVTANVESLVAKGEFHLASDLVADLERRFGADTDSRRMRLEIEKAQQQTEQVDVSEATRRVEDFLSVSAWPRAEGVANELIERHPDSAAARELANRIQRERQRSEQEQLRTAYVEIEGFTQRREWKHALGAARAFIEKYGPSPEAAVLRDQIGTLEANAEIEARHALELQIKELIKVHRYAEALDLARNVIRTYPNSPQATALQNQLPRLEARAEENASADE